MTKVHAKLWVAQTARVFALSTTLALAACGGGSDDSEMVGYGVKPDAGGQALLAATTIRRTDRALDVAIDGEGAFVMREPLTGTQVFSRLGHFDFDAQGRLVNDEGWLVEGVSEDLQLSTVAALKPLAPIQWFSLPQATGNVALDLNLDARKQVVDPTTWGSSRIDFNDAKTYNSATSVSIYDALGQEIGLTFYFQKVAIDTWKVYAGANGAPVNPDANGVPQPITTLNFPTDGYAPINPANANLRLPPVRLDVPVTENHLGAMTKSIPGLAVDLSGFHQFGAGFGVTNVLQDGYPEGVFDRLSFLSTGQLKIEYTNGRIDMSRRLVLARPTVADRLHRYGLSGWTCDRGCAQPLVDYPGGSMTGALTVQSLNTIY